MSSSQIQFAARDDRSTVYEFVARCDMCGIEHDFTVVVEPKKHGSAISVYSNKPTIMMYSGNHADT